MTKYAWTRMKGGGKAGRRRFRLWRGINGPVDECARAPAHNWLTAALVVVAQERPKLEAAVGAEEAQRFVEGIAAELKGMLKQLLPLDIFGRSIE